MATTAQFEARGSPESPAVERHFTVAEVAELWNVSGDTVRRIFEREPGVLVFGDQNPRHRRRHITLRIPASVLERVHRRLSVLDCAARRNGRC